MVMSSTGRPAGTVPKDEKALTVLLADAGLLGADSAPHRRPVDCRITAASSAPSRPVPLIVAAAALGGLVIGAAGSLLLLRRRPAVDRPRVTLSG